MKAEWWRSQGIFFTSLILFLVSVFFLYVTVETDEFYRTDVVTAEFSVILLSGGAAAFMVYKYITLES